MSHPGVEYFEEERPGTMSVDEMYAKGAPEVPPGQNWAVVTVLTPVWIDDPKYVSNPSGFKNQANELAVAIHGAFATHKEAMEYIERVQELGFNAFDLFVVKMNAFAPYPPPRDGSTVTVESSQERLKQVLQKNKKVVEDGRKLLKERIAKDKQAIKELNASRALENEQFRKVNVDVEVVGSDGNPVKIESSGDAAASAEVEVDEQELIQAVKVATARAEVAAQLKDDEILPSVREQTVQEAVTLKQKLDHLLAEKKAGRRRRPPKKSRPTAASGHDQDKRVVHSTGPDGQKQFSFEKDGLKYVVRRKDEEVANEEVANAEVENEQKSD